MKKKPPKTKTKEQNTPTKPGNLMSSSRDEENSPSESLADSSYKKPEWNGNPEAGHC